MGVSATGERGLRARTVPVLLLSVIIIFSAVYYAYGPPLTPGLRRAAQDKCNELMGANFRSYRLSWELPKSPAWDLPHWACADARDLSKEPKSFGWWVSPF
jgi:hypothetical protein